jgi:hypothetical protein
MYYGCPPRQVPTGYKTLMIAFNKDHVKHQLSKSSAGWHYPAWRDCGRNREKPTTGLSQSSTRVIREVQVLCQRTKSGLWSRKSLCKRKLRVHLCRLGLALVFTFL